MSEWIEIQMPPPNERPEHWILYFDSALNLEGAGVGEDHVWFEDRWMVTSLCDE
jgi:hypothetical protein